MRAAIFGVNDGLLSNLSLVLGVAGAGADSHALMVTGFAGLLAGAFSMAVGEFTSVASQRDILARQVELERRELAEAPEEETAELALIFQQKGLSAEHAARTAAELLKNPEHALDTLVREELGLDPDDLGSPWGAAGSSFATFAVGAFIPVVPFFFLQGTRRWWSPRERPAWSSPGWEGWWASWPARRPGSRRPAWWGSPRWRAGPPGSSGASSAPPWDRRHAAGPAYSLPSPSSLPAGSRMGNSSSCGASTVDRRGAWAAAFAAPTLRRS